MKTKNLVMAAVLLAVGTILHYIIPGIVNGVKPDFLLATMFFAILLNKDMKSAVAIGIVAGILAAVTTGFPGGQIPSLIDKIFSSIAFYGLVRAFNVERDQLVRVSVMTAVGTMISGALFLGSALLFVGLPGGAGFFGMMMAIVIPTAIANTIFGGLLCKIYDGFAKYSLA